MSYEQIANKVETTTTLDADINDSVTSLEVLSVANFPTTTPFRIIIDNEPMLVTGIASTTFTVTRAIEGTAVSHTAGADVKHVLTKGSLIKLIRNNANLINMPVLGDTAWNNQLSSTITEVENGLKLDFPAANASQFSARDQSVSSPFTVTAKIIPVWDPEGSDQYYHAGIILRGWTGDGSNTYRMFLGFRYTNSLTPSSPTLRVGRWSAVGSFDSEYYQQPLVILPEVKFLRIVQTSNRLYQYSPDGINFFTVYTESSGSYWVTPTHVGFGLYTIGSTNASMIVESWNV